MWPYWAMFVIPAMGAIVERSRGNAYPRAGHDPRLNWIAVWAAVALFVGLRSRVGGDWYNYEAMLDKFEGLSLWEAVVAPDPGFVVLNWITLQTGWGVVGVNMMMAALFALGLIRFCRSLPRPWLALAISVPYLVIVVGMGYSRQGVALACGMLGLLALSRHSTGAFLAWVVLGATFHKSAVFLLPIAALIGNRNRYVTALYAVSVTAAAYFLLLSDSAEGLYENYVLAEYQSEGALVRLLMNALPAALFLWNWKKFGFRPAHATLWRLFSWISLLLVGILFATGASTAVDRVGLYMLPLQLVVFASLPEVLAAGSRRTRSWVAVVALYYAVVLFTWLNFATHAQYWLPYRFYLLDW